MYAWYCLRESSRQVREGVSETALDLVVHKATEGISDICQVRDEHEDLFGKSNSITGQERKGPNRGPS